MSVVGPGIYGPLVIRLFSIREKVFSLKFHVDNLLQLAIFIHYISSDYGKELCDMAPQKNMNGPTV